MADPGDKKKRATYQDVLDAPDHMVAEIINGDLRLSPRPAGPHTVATSSLIASLKPPFDFGHGGGPGGWLILSEPELHLGDDILVPDIAGWRRAGFDRSELANAFIATAPDWVCEVLSPRTKTYDRAEKLPIYAAAGVQHVWMVQPVNRTIEVLRRQDDHWVSVATHIGSATVRLEPFEAIEIDLDLLWRDVPLPTRANEPGVSWEKSL